MANPFQGLGGKVQYIPGRVKTDHGSDNDFTPELKRDRELEEQVAQLANQRDLMMADLLEGDNILDDLDAAIDDQMKDFNLPGGEAAADAAEGLCGSSSIDWECYKKAKELLRIAPWIANGFDPVQAVFAGTAQDGEGAGAGAGGLRKRAGQVIYNCQEFDPDKFHSTNENEDGNFDDASSKNGEDADADMGYEALDDLNKRAQENQKDWANGVLFWEYIWGRPVVKESFLESNRGAILEIQAEAERLSDAGQKEAAKKLIEGTMDKLPDIVSDGRPIHRHQLVWSGIPFTKDLDHVTRNNKEWDTSFKKTAAAVYIDPWSLIKEDDKYKDRGIPVVKIGFLLALLIGVLSIPAKVITGIMNVRLRIVNLMKKLRKIPFVGKKLFHAWKACVSYIFIPWAYINNAFIGMCIWLAMKPSAYDIEFDSHPSSEIPDNAGVRDPKELSTGVPVKTSMNIKDTQSGFVPLDCLEKAQRIVNKVHTHANE